MWSGNRIQSGAELRFPGVGEAIAEVLAEVEDRLVPFFELAATQVAGGGADMFHMEPRVAYAWLRLERDWTEVTVPAIIGYEAARPGEHPSDILDEMLSKVAVLALLEDDQGPNASCDADVRSGLYQLRCALDLRAVRGGGERWWYSRLEKAVSRRGGVSRDGLAAAD